MHSHTKSRTLLMTFLKKLWYFSGIEDPLQRFAFGSDAHEEILAELHDLEVPDVDSLNLPESGAAVHEAEPQQGAAQQEQPVAQANDAVPFALKVISIALRDIKNRIISLDGTKCEVRLLARWSVQCTAFSRCVHQNVCCMMSKAIIHVWSPPGGHSVCNIHPA